MLRSQAEGNASGQPTSSMPKHTFAVVLDDQSTCPALSQDSFLKFLRWKLVTPVRIPVYGWKNCHIGVRAARGAQVAVRLPCSTQSYACPRPCSHQLFAHQSVHPTQGTQSGRQGRWLAYWALRGVSAGDTVSDRSLRRRKEMPHWQSL